MYCESCSEPIEVQGVVRMHNRALRRIVRNLRKVLQRNRIASDEVFEVLCETDVAAEQAMRELWERGGFQPPIGPQDYPEIVELAIRALAEYRDGRTSLAAESAD